MATQRFRQYQSYLLRCWQEGDESQPNSDWRFSLEDPRTGQRRGYANLETLMMALQKKLSRVESGRRPLSEE